jgi:hypothetical protein
MPKFSDLLGTVNNTFQIGIAGAGAKVLRFFNGFTGSLSWNPTANRTLTLPDKSGTLVISSDIDFTNTVTIVSRSTAAGNESVTGQSFVAINPDQVDSDIGGNWNSSTKRYTVPSTGTYMCILTVRPLDDSSLMSFGTGVHTSAIDGSWFLWNATRSGITPTNRNGSQNIRIMTFTAENTIFPYVYMDKSGTVQLAGYQLVIFRLF